MCTIQNRLRDAINSWIENKWPTRLFDIDKLISVGPSIKVSEKIDCIIAYYNSAEILTAVVTNVPMNVFRSGVVPALNGYKIEPADLLATVKLADAGLLNNSVIVETDAATASDIEDKYDVSLLLQPDGTYRLK